MCSRVNPSSAFLYIAARSHIGTVNWFLTAIRAAASLAGFAIANPGRNETRARQGCDACTNECSDDNWGLLIRSRFGKRTNRAPAIARLLTKINGGPDKWRALYTNYIICNESDRDYCACACTLVGKITYVCKNPGEESSIIIPNSNSEFYHIAFKRGYM